MAPEDRLLLVTYNKTLIKYLKHLYSKVEEKYQVYYSNIFTDDEDKVNIQTIDSIMHRYYAAAPDNKSCELLLDGKQAREKVDQKYNHIIVDETQDLTRVQLDFIKLLYESGQNSSITFIVDTAQSIYPHSWLVKGRSFTSIGFDMTGKSNSLCKNYVLPPRLPRPLTALSKTIKTLPWEW